MAQEQLRSDMEKLVGPVQSAFEKIPKGVQEDAWNLWKHWTTYEGEIPCKWRALIGLAAAAASENEFGIIWHTEFAKADGATEEEIKEVLFTVKDVAGWGPFMKGEQADVEQFKRDAPEAVRKIKEYMESKRSAERASM